MSNRSISLTDSLYDYLLSVSLREPPLLLQLRDGDRCAADARQMQIAPEQGQFMALLRATDRGQPLPRNRRVHGLLVARDGARAARRRTCRRLRRQRGVDGDRPALLAPRGCRAQDRSAGSRPRYRHSMRCWRPGRPATFDSPSSTRTRRTTAPTTSAPCSCCARAVCSSSTTRSGSGRWPTRRVGDAGYGGVAAASTSSCTGTHGSTSACCRSGDGLTLAANSRRKNGRPKAAVVRLDAATISTCSDPS